MTLRNRIPRSWLLPLMVFVLLAVAIGVGSLLHFTQYAEEMEAEVSAELSAIAALKVDQIANWYRERLGDARVIAENPVIARRADELFRGMRTASTAAATQLVRNEMRSWLESRRRNYEYEALFLLDAARRLQLTAGPDDEMLNAVDDSLMKHAAANNVVVVGDLQLIEATNAVRMDIVVPLLRSRGTLDPSLIGFVILRVNPQQFLFPLVQTWPAPSRTAETIFFRQEGDSILYLNELRHRPGTAMRLRLPVADERLIAAKAARGEEGIVEGVDYRGVEVLAAIRRVPGTPWLMVAKVDKEEILSPLYDRNRTTGLILVILVLLAGALTGLLWRWRQSRHYRELFEIEQSKRVLTEHFDHVLKYANDIILLTDDRLRLVEVNDRALQAYGYTHDELIGEHVGLLRAQEEVPALPDLVGKVAAGNGLVYRTLHRRKDGSVFPVESSARLITIEGKKFYQAIIRDITEREHAEARIAQLNRLYRVLSGINQVIVRAVDRDELFREACRIIVEVGKYRMAWIGTVDEETQTVRPVSYYGSGVDYLQNIVISVRDVPEGRGPTGTAIREQRLISCNDIATDPIAAPWRVAALKRGYLSSCAVPVKIGPRVIAAFNLYAGEKHAFTDEEKELLIELASDLSFALEKMEQETARQEAEERLKESEAWMSGLLEASRDGVVVERNESIVYANHAFAGLYGYASPDDLLGRHISTVQSPADSERMLEYGRRRLRGESAPSLYEFRGKRKDGTFIELEASISTFRVDDQQYIVSVIRDIAERKRAEDRLRLSDEILQRVGSIVLVGNERGDIVYASPSIQSILGYAPSELLGTGWWNVSRRDEETRTKDREALARCARGEAPVSEDQYENLILNKAGEERWILWQDAKGPDGLVIGVGQDITERKLSEQRVQAAEQRLRDIVEHSTNLFYSHTVDHQLTYVSPQTRAILDCEPEEALVRWTEFVTDNPVNQAGLEVTEKAIRTGQQQAPYELELRGKSGRKVWVEVREAPVVRDGKTIAIVGSLSDITEKKKAEDALRQSEERYRSVVESLNQAYYEADSQGRFTYCNPGMLLISGYSEKELLGTLSFRLVDPQYRRQVMTAYGRGLREKPTDMALEFMVRTKTGRRFWVEQATHFEFDHTGALVKATNIFRDIDERRRAEDALRSSEARYREVVENATEVIFTTDRDGYFRYINPAAQRLSGYTLEELQKFRFSDLVTEEHRRRIITAYYRQFLNRTENVYTECPFRTKQGGLVWLAQNSKLILEQGDVKGFHVISRDITERKRVEEALVSERTLLRTLIDLLPDNIFVKDAECRFLLNNAAHLRALGAQSQEEALGKSDYDFRPPNLAAQYLRDDKLVIDTGQPLVNREEEGIHTDGEIGWHLATKVPLRDAQGNVVGLVGISHDITERRRAEEAIREREFWLRESQRVGHIGSYVLDIKSGLWTSSEVLDEIFGIDPASEKTVSRWNELIHPDEREEMLRYFLHDVVGQKHPFNKEYRILRANDGEERWLWGRGELLYGEDGEPTQMLGTIQDITDRKHAERALSESEERYRLIQNQSPDAMFLFDVSTKRLLEANSAFLNLLGYSAADVPSLALYDVVAHDREEVDKNLDRVLAAGSIMLADRCWRRKDGSLLNVDVSISTIRQNNRSLVFVAGRDITDRKHAEEERKQLQLQVMQAQKLESIGTLASGIAHDFNNVLGIILGHSGLLEKVRTDERRFVECVRAIDKAVQRGASLVRQILTFARKTDVQVEAVDVNDIVKELATMLEQTFPRMIAVRTELHRQLPIISCDPTQVHQALLNLCVNARDAMGSAGQLTIRTRTVAGTELTGRFADARANYYVAIDVSDTGTGITDEVRHKLFEPFYTTKEHGKGTGLGLAVVYGVVRAHEGFIDVESEVGIGTTFSMYLPVVGKPSGSHEQTVGGVEAVRGGNETILVVEDEPMLQELVTIILTDKGYTVLRADDGQEGVRLFLEHRDRIDLVITDLGLPRLSGADVLDAIKRAKAETAVIMASGYVEPNGRAELINKGAFDILMKPYEPDVILKRVREALDATRKKAEGDE